MNMNNRPYISETSNVYNENLYNTIPAQYGNTNVLVTHGQHRKLFDTTSTSIAGQSTYQPQQQMNYMYNQQNPQQQPYQINGQRQMVPNGLSYTFNPYVSQNYNSLNSFNPTYYGGQLYGNNNNQNMNYPPPYTSQQQIALNQLQRQALESMLLQDQFRKNPFRLQFHKNERTDTEDLAFKCQTCMSQKTLLNCMESEAVSAKANQPKPEQIYPESTKRKQLRINEQNKFEDKGIQNTPTQESIEIQNDLIVDCTCHKKDRSKMTDSETETKKVTFNDSNKKSTTKTSKRRRKRTRSRSRQVDEDSSESSHTSQSSDESNN